MKQIALNIRGLRLYFLLDISYYKVRNFEFIFG